MALRDFLAGLEALGLLRTVRKQVSPDFEVAAILKKAQALREAAILFERIKGCEARVVGNLLATEERFGLALGAKGGRKEARQRLMEAARSNPGDGDKVVLRNPEEGSGWVRLRAGEIDLRGLLPRLTNADAERGIFVNAGVLFVRVASSALPAFQVVQMEVKGADELALSPVAPPLDAVFREAEKEGHTLEAAVAIGVDPVVLVAGSSPAVRAEDRWRLARALKGGPLVFMPRMGAPEAEIMIKGRVTAAHSRIGPYACYLHVYYERAGKYLLKVEEVMHRLNRLYQVILPDGRETFLLMALPAEAWMLQALRRSFPWVLDVRFTDGGCAHTLVVQVQSPGPQAVRDLMHYLLRLPYFVKFAIVVDEDVDPASWMDIEWALVTRVQPDRDLLVEKAMGSRLDPSTGFSGVTAKMAVDATKPPDLPGEFFARARVPVAVKEMVEKNWRDYWEGEG